MLELLKYPHENGILTFTLGIMFILTVYHALLYFQHKDKLYLLYSAYTFFIILSQLQFFKQGFIEVLVQPFGESINYGELYTETYYIIYFLFAFKFLNVDTEFPKWTNYVNKSIFVLALFCLVVFVLYLITANYAFVRQSYFIFVALITILSIVAYILFFRLNNSLKYYIIVGGLVLSICSYISLAYFLVLVDGGNNPESAYSILYIGFIIENILFSLGLGKKQKLILDERNESQERLIDQLKKNEKLREIIQKNLESDVKGLSQQAEAEKLEKVKLKFEKELAELRVSALRSQMNPHFIFNSLNSVKRYIIDNEKQNAVYYLNKFSKLIRKILSASMEKQISLADELETTELYVNVENIRFNNSIDFQLTVEEGLNLETIKIPSLILQPFLENAIWHGLSLKKKDKQLSIKVEKEQSEYLKIEILDNGIGRAKAAEIKKNKIHKRDSVGIAITEERLKNFAKSMQYDYDLQFIDLLDDKNKPSGTKVVLKFPLK